MAVAPGLVPTLARAAFNLLGAPGIRGTEWAQTGAPSQAAAVARAIMRNYSNLAGINLQQVNAIVRDVRAAQRAGQDMILDPTRAPGRTELPRDRELMPDEERYRYSVVIERQLPDGSVRRELAEVRDNTPLTANQVETLVRMNDFTPLSPPTAGRPGTPTVSSTHIVSVTVISAGQRP